MTEHEGPIDVQQRLLLEKQTREVADLIAARSGSLAPRSLYSAAVGATSPSVLPSAAAPGRVWVTRTA